LKGAISIVPGIARVNDYFAAFPSQATLMRSLGMGISRLVLEFLARGSGRSKHAVQKKIGEKAFATERVWTDEG